MGVRHEGACRTETKVLGRSGHWGRGRGARAMTYVRVTSQETVLDPWHHGHRRRLARAAALARRRCRCSRCCRASSSRSLAVTCPDNGSLTNAVGLARFGDDRRPTSRSRSRTRTTLGETPDVGPRLLRRRRPDRADADVRRPDDRRRLLADGCTASESGTYDRRASGTQPGTRGDLRRSRRSITVDRADADADPDADPEADPEADAQADPEADRRSRPPSRRPKPTPKPTPKPVQGGREADAQARSRPPSRPRRRPRSPTPSPSAVAPTTAVAGPTAGADARSTRTARRGRPPIAVDRRRRPRSAAVTTVAGGGDGSAARLLDLGLRHEPEPVPRLADRQRRWRPAVPVPHAPVARAGRRGPGRAPCRVVPDAAGRRDADAGPAAPRGGSRPDRSRPPPRPPPPAVARRRPKQADEGREEGEGREGRRRRSPSRPRSRVEAARRRRRRSRRARHDAAAAARGLGRLRRWPPTSPTAAAARATVAAKGEPAPRTFDKPPAKGVERVKIGYRRVRLSDAPDDVGSRELGRLDRGDEVEIVGLVRGLPPGPDARRRHRLDPAPHDRLGAPSGRRAPVSGSAPRSARARRPSRDRTAAPARRGPSTAARGRTGPAVPCAPRGRSRRRRPAPRPAATTSRWSIRIPKFLWNMPAR